MNAYSEDLRKKIVEAVSERGVGKSEAARTFSVSLSSVQRYVGMASKGESLAPKPRDGPFDSYEIRESRAPYLGDRALEIGSPTWKPLDRAAVELLIGKELR